MEIRTRAKLNDFLSRFEANRDSVTRDEILAAADFLIMRSAPKLSRSRAIHRDIKLAVSLLCSVMEVPEKLKMGYGRPWAERVAAWWEHSRPAV